MFSLKESEDASENSMSEETQELSSRIGQSLASRMAVCHGCDESISDEYIFRVAPDLQWHSSCLRCSVCDTVLSDSPSCFMKNGILFCKIDYDQRFVAKCHGCGDAIDKSSLVMSARNFLYHVDCFLCTVCHEQLNPGDQFSLSSEDNLYCQSENCIQERMPSWEDSWSDGNSNVSIGTYKDTAASIDLESSPGPSNSDKEIKMENLAKGSKGKAYGTAKKNCKDKPTRVRTVLNEKQLSTLKRCYAANPRPDSVMKEQLVDMTGLSPRVIRVWFQNKRCKDKKKMMLNCSDGGKIGDILQNRMPMHSSPLSDEISLPGCSPPLPGNVHSLSMVPMASHASTYANQHGQDLRIIASQAEYRETASFSSYGLWAKYGGYDCPYQESNVQNSHYQQLVS